MNGEVNMQKISRREYIHKLLHPNNIKPDWNAALYMYAALIILFIIAQLLKLGNLTIAFVLGGVLISQLVNLNIPVKTITRLNIITSILVGIAFLTAALGLINDWIALIFLLVWVFLSSSLNIIGKFQGRLGYVGLVIYLIAILAIVNNQSTAIQWGIWALIGSLIASFIFIIPKILQKDKTTRKLVASCFIPNADTNTLIQAKTLLEKSHPTPKIVSLMELSRFLLTTRQLTSTIKPNLKGEAKEIFKEFYTEINKLSEKVANYILNDDTNPDMNITILKQKIDEMTSVTGLNEDTRTIVLKNMKGYQEIFEKSDKVLKGELVLDIPPLLTSSEISPGEKLRANFNLHNMYIRHGIRISFAVGLAFILTLFTSSHNFYWISFSILAVLQPDISSTIDRMIIRITATTVGIILAIIISGILISLGLQVIIYAFILILLAVIIAYSRVSWLYYVVAVAMLIIFLQPSADIITTGLARFTDVIIGSVIAFVVGYLILPSKLTVNLKQQLVTRIKSNIDYIHFATNPAHDDTTNKKKTSLAMQEMILSHNNLEAGINKVISSYDDAGDDIKILNSIAEANDRLSRDLSTSVNRIITSKEKHPIWEPTTKKMEQILTDLKNTVENGAELPLSGLISTEIEEIKTESSDNDTKIIFEYLKWIISDINSLYDSIKQAKDNEIFTKYKKL